ncbi:hypothetical protein DW061_05455 [Ruminococcus sp. AF42-9BH]|nr:hypothetical protein DW061_05455 [Ruminococcus sp. AF42-9BH]RHQ98273.1 hypothetical protein DWX80_01070 [Ruminococcus sp. AF21-3]
MNERKQSLRKEIVRLPAVYSLTAYCSSQPPQDLLDSVKFGHIEFEKSSVCSFYLEENLIYLHELD